ncbi:hypothetical protein PHYPSEUDO_001680 [Phytophthora pseudosyringae]|uniref:Uncharacterized protein n=1 Tax=Phytophthora pseudosyringae TaxID=221518 RepID=A0A8T1VZG6_9STRA|nr:hypothetical protein PHYPSEUDO_001680 [Phytophthora pseudosyringae]
MAETDTDAAYSDEEFGSEHAYEGGDEEFADGNAVVDGMKEPVNNTPVGTDAEEYDGEFDEEDQTEVAAGSPTSEGDDTPPTDPDTNVIEDNPDAYDGGFEEDDPTVADTRSPTADKYDTTTEKTPTAVDVTTTVPQEEKELGEVDEDADKNCEGEYSNDLENDIPVTLPVHTRPRNSSEDNLTQRRSNVPSTRLLEDSSPKAGFVRADSMPVVLSVTPPDQWMDTKEFSLEKHGQSNKQSACCPVLDETQPKNLSEDEHNTEEADNVGDGDQTNYVPSTAMSRVRARSYQDLQVEKVIVSVRRTQSLLYAGSLLSAEGIHAAEETIDAAHNREGEDSYSDNEGSYGHISFESEHDNDASSPAKVERPKSGPKSAIYAMSAVHDSNTAKDEPATTLSGDIDPTPSVSARNEQSLSKGNTPALNPPQNNDDDYADELEDEFPSDSNSPQYESTPNKSRDEASNYDVDEFNKDGRRETEILLQEARTLLELQQTEIKADKQPSDQQDITMPSGMTTPPSVEGTPGSVGAEPCACPYEEEEEEFADADADAEALIQEISHQETAEDHGEIGQYELDVGEFEDQEVKVLPRADPMAPSEVMESVKTTDSAVPHTVKATEDTQPASEMACTEISEDNTKDEAAVVSPREMLSSALGDVNAQASRDEPPQTFQSVDPPLASLAVKQDQKKAPATSNPNEPPKPIRPEKERVASRPARPTQPVKNMEPSVKQPSPLMKPSRPPAKNEVPTPPSAPSTSPTDNKVATTPRSSRSTMKTTTSDCQQLASYPTACTSSATESSSHETTTSNPSPTRQGRPPTTRQKVSSPRSPSKAYSGSYQYLPNEYPQLPRKEPVPRQNMSSKPSTSGDHGGKRRLLQPVRTSANLRFNLPKMDKTTRDWLFVNMFRHGDDLGKYEAFVPPTLLARPPTTKETKKRPLSSRQVYGGNPHSSRFVASGRKLVPQPNPEQQNRELNWVSTTPHDSKLPPYDSILDKYCTTVTRPVVQRHIYQTRHQDLSPQLAFVLEKRVEKQCRKGFYDSFGGVSSSYKTEIVPTSPEEGTRQRQMSLRSLSKSALLER